MRIKFKKHIALACLAFFAFDVAAQKFFRGGKEFGILLGGSNYHGDLAREIVFEEFKPMIGAYYERNYNEWFSMRYQFAYGQISGSDENFEILKNRNLSFFSNIFEASVITEFNFNPFGLNPNLSSFSPYVFTGLAMFYFDPKTTYRGETVSLRNLGTEGQGLDGKKRYSRIQPAIPLGFGLKIKQSQHLVVGLEVGFRKTFTDYLDDVSGEYPDYGRMTTEKGILAADLSHRYKEVSNTDYTSATGSMRGDPHLNDWYFFVNLRIGYKFGKEPCASNYSF